LTQGSKGRQAPAVGGRPGSSTARAALSANPTPSRSASPDDLLGRRKLSVARATLECMEVTENDIERIPVRNLRVPRDDFVAVWAAAERRNTE
jgi:hypothetical protein